MFVLAWKARTEVDASPRPVPAPPSAEKAATQNELWFRIATGAVSAPQAGFGSSSDQEELDRDIAEIDRRVADIEAQVDNLDLPAADEERLFEERNGLLEEREELQAELQAPTSPDPRLLEPERRRKRYVNLAERLREPIDYPGRESDEADYYALAPIVEEDERKKEEERRARWSEVERLLGREIDPLSRMYGFSWIYTDLGLEWYSAHRESWIGPQEERFSYTIHYDHRFWRSHTEFEQTAVEFIRVANESKYHSRVPRYTQAEFAALGRSVKNRAFLETIQAPLMGAMGGGWVLASEVLDVASTAKACAEEDLFACALGVVSGGPPGRPPSTPRARPRGERRARTEKYEIDLDEKLDRDPRYREVSRQAKEEFAAYIAGYFPEGTRVQIKRIERTEAGRAQGRAVTPERTAFPQEWEYVITLPKGLKFNADAIVPIGGGSYLIQEHKEVLTVWERSWYSTEAATKELDVRLGEHLEAYRDLKEHGCAGFQYTTNDDALAKLLAERISALRKRTEDAKALLPPPL